jgi:hypothetical protein
MQGFSKNLAMPKTQWSGFIKDYDGAHLMECYIHPTLNFLDVRAPACLPACLSACLLASFDTDTDIDTEICTCS